MPTRTEAPPVELARRLTRRHLLIGWIGLLIFLTLGIALEGLHGFKASYYLDTRNVTRRLMWTLAHAHGTLFSLVHIGFAVSLCHLGAAQAKRLRLASFGLISALTLLPLGFFLGGLKLYGGDPGLGILLVPVGAIMLLLGVGTFTVDLVRQRASFARAAEDGGTQAGSVPRLAGDPVKKQKDIPSSKFPRK